MKYLTMLACVALAAFAQDRSVPIDNDQVKVLNVKQAGHIKTSLHKHDMNRVMIYLQPGQQTIEYQGAPTAHLTWKAGQALWSPKSGMHIAEITSDNPVTIVELELKNKGGKVTQPALDGPKVSPKHYLVEMDNDQVRVIRSKIGTKESVPMHEHGLNRVVVFLTDASIRVTSADGKVDMVQRKAGDIGWGTPLKHKEENLGGPIEIVAVEIK